jgi:hypothetical protein
MIGQQIFPPPLLVLLYRIRDTESEIRDLGSGIWDPGSAIRDPGWIKIRILDPG